MIMEHVTTVKGSPTKLFFIDMLTRDITVSDAIGDLVDNAVDAARKIIYKNESSKYDLFSLKYDNTKITVDFDETKFVILDNAGGIPIEIAREYAFRFGRPEEFDGTPGSIGQFGIGMKRAFFKLGKTIEIESSTEQDGYFKIRIDVDDWKKAESWDFQIHEIKNEYAFETGYGTKITIMNLYDSTKALFKDEVFLNSLIQEIGIENWYNTSKGMKIFINSIPLISKDLSLLEDPGVGLTIARWQHNYKEENVDVRIVCGIGPKNKKEDGGWYIFCNDRLILAADQTATTGWSGGGRKVKGGPEYHSQYERFRGFVFFESEKPSNFPWNTAKTGLNSEHPLYISVKEKMISMMHDVNAFLNKIKSERDGQGRGKNQPLSPTEQKLDKAIALPLKDVVTRTLTKTKFSAPETAPPQKKSKAENAVNICYEVSVDQFNVVAKYLNLEDAKQVGIQTFNYFIENEAIQ